MCFCICTNSQVNAVLEVGDGVFEVLSTSGDTHLGGDDFDKVLKWQYLLLVYMHLFRLYCAYTFFIKQRTVDWLAENFRKEEGIDLLKDKQALQRLTEAAEKAKIELSTLTQTNIRYVSVLVVSCVHKIIASFSFFAPPSWKKNSCFCLSKLSLNVPSLLVQFAIHHCYCRWSKTY